MKFRTFITTLSLFLVMFYFGLLLISLFMFKSQIDSARDRSLNEHYLIASSFGKDLAAVSMRSGSLDESIQPLFIFYTDNYSRQGVFLEIARDGVSLYSSVPERFAFSRELQKPEVGSKTVSIERNGGSIFVYVNGRLPGTEGYCLQYIRDISESILEWKQSQQIMLWVGTFFSVIMALFLSFTLNRVLRPLSLVSSASKEIADGKYGNKIIIQGHDEIAEMAASFNNMAEEIRKHISRLAEDSQKKQRFVDNFSHEIRTPLTSIYGYAEYLQKTVSCEEEKFEFSERIITESRHMLDIADRMLELATLRSPEINAEEVNVDELFHSVKELLNSRLAKKRINLKWDCSIDNLYGDRTLLKSLLVNLTDNAVKACNPGGHIVWKAFYSPHGNVLAVEDDGRGISAEQIEHITEPFYRIDKSKSKTSGGIGLGLSICEQICLCHNAVLSFESFPGSGTTANVTFTTQ